MQTASEIKKETSSWMTIGEAAKYLGVSRDTLRRWEKAGKISAVRSPTNRRFYTKKQLEEVLSKKQAKQELSTQITPHLQTESARLKHLMIMGAVAFIAGVILIFVLQLVVFR